MIVCSYPSKYIRYVCHVLELIGLTFSVEVKTVPPVVSAKENLITSHISFLVLFLFLFFNQSIKWFPKSIYFNCLQK